MHTPSQKAIPHLQIDFGAIAKGYAIDKIHHRLKQRDYQNYIIEIGGEIFATGQSRKDTPWRIAIDKPVKDSIPGQHVQTIISLSNQAIATSGSYRNYLEMNGTKTVSHIIDPRTGYPVSHTLESVTVTAPTCTEADALATALMVMGLEDGQPFIEQRPATEALFIIRNEDGLLREYRSSGFPETEIIE